LATLDDDDPVWLLSQQLQRVCLGHDGGTVTAALALTLGSVMALVFSKMGGSPPAHLAELRGVLNELTADILRERDRAPRES
jgi:hypothetical protein